jgi:hypothetical protein
MSDIITTGNEPAIELLRERVTQIQTRINARALENALDTSTVDELLDLIATLSRKPRAKKVRAQDTEPRPANDTPDEPRPTVFATPPVEEAA